MDSSSQQVAAETAPFSIESKSVTYEEILRMKMGSGVLVMLVLVGGGAAAPILFPFLLTAPLWAPHLEPMIFGKGVKPVQKSSPVVKTAPTVVEVKEEKKAVIEPPKFTGPLSARVQTFLDNAQRIQTLKEQGTDMEQRAKEDATIIGSRAWLEERLRLRDPFRRSNATAQFAGTKTRSRRKRADDKPVIKKEEPEEQRQDPRAASTARHAAALRDLQAGGSARTRGSTATGTSAGGSSAAGGSGTSAPLRGRQAALAVEQRAHAELQRRDRAEARRLQRMDDAVTGRRPGGPFQGQPGFRPMTGIFHRPAQQPYIIPQRRGVLGADGLSARGQANGGPTRPGGAVQGAGSQGATGQAGRHSSLARGSSRGGGASQTAVRPGGLRLRPASQLLANPSPFVALNIMPPAARAGQQAGQPTPTRPRAGPLVSRDATPGASGVGSRDTGVQTPSAMGASGYGSRDTGSQTAPRGAGASAYDHCRLQRRRRAPRGFRFRPKPPKRPKVGGGRRPGAGLPIQRNKLASRREALEQKLLGPKTNAKPTTAAAANYKRLQEKAAARRGCPTF